MSTRKKYKIQKRFELWVETTVRADSMADAVEQSRKMDYDEFVDVPESTEVLDCTSMDGTGVIEEW